MHDILHWGNHMLLLIRNSQTILLTPIISAVSSTISNGIDLVLYVALFKGIGVVAYAHRVPERFFPVTLDIVGQSHQMLHVFVIVAGIMDVMGCFGDFDHLHEYGSRCI
ncbi:hypothetical protein H9L39_10732 [Fusarium oxysporum f. sp. albedinis]|nr:hypothetical protein H9L39_10732 [Fusarium oxysporum f. sp. albedinis]